MSKCVNNTNTKCIKHTTRVIGIFINSNWCMMLLTEKEKTAAVFLPVLLLYHVSLLFVSVHFCLLNIRWKLLSFISLFPSLLTCVYLYASVHLCITLHAMLAWLKFYHWLLFVPASLALKCSFCCGHKMMMFALIWCTCISRVTSHELSL